MNVLDASVYAEYGGTSIVLDLLGNWLLLVSGSNPTADKPTVTLGPLRDPDYQSTELIFRVRLLQGHASALAVTRCPVLIRTR